MTSYLHRKYIDLIRQASNKYVNWDPQHPVKIGTYGLLDKETGVLQVEGNIYDPEFQHELDKHDAGIKMSDFLPQEGPVEDDLIVNTRGAKRSEVDKEVGIPGIANAPIKGKWVFEHGDRRDAILIMHKPRQISIPPNVVLEPLYKVDKLVEKALVTSIYVCPAYSMYLSERTGKKMPGNTVSIALVPKTPTASAPDTTADASGAFTWWFDAPNGLFREGCDETGKHTFTPFYTLQRPIKRIRRFFRDKIRPEPEGDELWYYEIPSWEPLDEDGEEDPLDPEYTKVDPFANVNAEYARKKKEEEEARLAALSQ